MFFESLLFNDKTSTESTSFIHNRTGEHFWEKEQHREKERAREKGGRVRDSAWLGKGYNFSPILQFGDTPYFVKRLQQSVLIVQRPYF